MKVWDISKLPYEKIGSEIKHIIFTGSKNSVFIDNWHVFCDLIGLDKYEIIPHSMGDENIQDILQEIVAPCLFGFKKIHIINDIKSSG